MLRPVPMKRPYRFVLLAFCASFSFVLLHRVLVVPFPELAFRLQPLVQVVVQVANVTATFVVNLSRPPMDFVQGWDALTYFFWNVRPDTSRPRVLSIRGQILRVYVLFSFQSVL
jgi:hypothetical protein